MDSFNIKKFELKCVIVVVALALIISFTLNVSLTGFAVEDDKSKNKENTTLDEGINATTETSTANESVADEAKDTKENPKKSKEENTPPVWKSDISEFTLKGKTVIDLSQYFYDKENDSLAYLFTTPENIEVGVDGSILTLTPKIQNFSTTIKFTATDGDKATTKEINLIVPEKTIKINVEYKAGTPYNVNDNGYEPTTGIIDITVENSNFNWDANQENLCTRWNVYSFEDEKSTTLCYGSKKCCNFVGLEPARDKWNEIFYSNYGQYGATLNNSISAQILYANYNLSVNEPFAEIYYSAWQNLTARYYFASIDFKNVCVGTCSLSGFDDASYKLIFEINNAILNLDTLTYSVGEETSNVQVNLEIKDSEGAVSGNYTLYKDNAPVTQESVAPDYYDIEVMPKDNIIDKLVIKNVNITKPLTAIIGIDNVSREISVENAEIKKKYAVDLEKLEFEKAVLTATATADSLYKCRQWDYGREVCFGSWEKIRNLAIGQQYELTLTKDDPGFIEGNLNITPSNITINITGLAFIKNISNITIAVNGNASVNLSDYFANIEDNTIFTYYKTNNISIFFDNNSATIVPDKDFIGNGYTFITANKSDNLAISNLFLISVKNATTTPSIEYSIIDPLMQQKLKVYADANFKTAFKYNKIVFTDYKISGDVITIYMTIDGKNLKWVTSVKKFNEIATANE